MATTGTTGPVSSAGLTTPSIDVAGIVSQLITAEQQPITGLNSQISSYQSKISAVGTVQSALNSLQTASQSLSSLTFSSYSATSSNTAALSATASSIASTGNYSVSISQLAQSQSLVASGQASATTAIGSGATTTLTFNFGTISGGSLNATTGTYTGASFLANGSAAKTVTIDASNNTLSGIRDAINAANIGVTASIVNDGTANPYRLVLTSNTTGVANSMQISASGDASISSLLSYNPAGTQNLSQTSAAQNASFSVNGVAISKASNTVGDAISGVTLNLTSTTTSPLTLSVAPNTSAVTQAINNFVKAYNGVVQNIQNLTSYDPTTKTAGTLQGDITLSLIQSQLNKMLTQNTGSNSASYSNLSQIGIGFQQDGTLAVDATKLNNALTSDYQGVAGLFIASGTSSDSLVKYVSATSNTAAGSYDVNVTQLATQGYAKGSITPGLTITTGSNDTVNLTVDGVSTSITVPAGTYTASSLATQLQTSINSSTPISSAGKSVTVTQDPNTSALVVTSSSYGSSSSVVVSGGNGASYLFGTPNPTTGLDVAGTIGGISATGNGQLLTASNGLAISIQGGTTGSRGTITYSQGLSSLFSSQVTSMLSNTGQLTSETNQFNNNIKDLQNQINDLNTRIALDQATLTTQYSQLDAMLGTMNQLSSYLTQQLSRLP